MRNPPFRIVGRHVAFIVFVAISVGIFWNTLRALVLYSLHDPSYSHIVLIPFISFILVFMERERIFLENRSSISFGAILIVTGICIYRVAASSASPEAGSYFLAAATISLICIWVGGFASCYGTRALRAAIFPLLFLLLMVPLPDPILDRTIYFLQQGSAEIAYALFKVAGVPAFKQGFLISVPGVTIEVAKECSSIRSSTALFITCLLAGHFFLRTPWKILLFAAVSLPVAVVKNGIRIATLTLLSIYVDPSFLTGNLHRYGGFVFFLLALAIQWPVLVFLQKSEGPESTAASAAGKTGAQLAPG